MTALEEIPQYLQTLFDGTEGFIYAPVKNPNGSFTREFFAWPDDMAKLMVKIRSFYDRGDLYVGPAIYRETGNATKSGILYSKTVWVEFDGNYNPDIWGVVPPPTLEIQSSSVGRMHCYWELSDFIGLLQLERITRALSYSLQADPSCWDATQLLRPPGTLNSKRGVRTTLSVARHIRYSPDAFIPILSNYNLPEVPAPTGTYPPVSEVLSNYTGLPRKVYGYLLGGIELEDIEDRSNALMEIGYLLAEYGMPKDAMMSILYEADDRFEKFIKRDHDNREQLLWNIVVLAKDKYPEDAPKSLYLSPLAIVQSEEKVEWVWEGLLPLGGSLMISGAPGVGKSQLTLDALAHIATGTSYLGWETRKMKVGFASLEMGKLPLKNIFSAQLQKWKPQQIDEIEKNLVLYPRGEALYLDTKEGREDLEKFIQSNSLEGLVIDSLAATTGEEFSSEKVAKGILDFLISLKAKYGIFLWLIHHNRKATSENKKPNSIHDIHGAVAITARMDSAVTMWKHSHKLMFLPRKTRMSDLDQFDFELTRGKDLTFQLANQSKGINVKEKGAVGSEKHSTAASKSTFGLAADADNQ